MSPTYPITRGLLRRPFWLLTIVGTLIGFDASQASELRETGRSLAPRYEKAIVTVRVVSSQTLSMSGKGSRQRDDQSETNGTVVSPEGVTVVALSGLDPSSVYESMMANGGTDVGIQFESQIKDLTLIVDKTEQIPARVVLRDKDLDLAVIQPVEKPKEPMTYVDFAQSAVPELLDPCLVLARMSSVANYEPAVMTGEIQALVKKPTTYYVPSSEISTGGSGIPVFNAEGQVLGIVSARLVSGGLEAVRDADSPGMVVIQPASDVLELVEQAKGME